LHEVAHALFDQLHIPILGREEDAADQFAPFTLVHLNEQTARDTVFGVGWTYAQQAKEATLSRSDLADITTSRGSACRICSVSHTARSHVCSRIWSRRTIYLRIAHRICADEHGQVAYAIKTLMGCYMDLNTREKVFAKDWAGGRLRKRVAGDTPPH
jgi:hypothetical protein